MMTSHELIGFMRPALAAEILDHTYGSDKELYRATLGAVAEARKLRMVFFEKKPRQTRHQEMVATLSSPRMETAAAALLRAWLLKAQTPMLTDFLNALGVEHKEGVVDDFPEKIAAEKVQAGVDLLVSKYPKENVAIYLNAFQAMNPEVSPLLKEMLHSRAELQLA